MEPVTEANSRPKLLGSCRFTLTVLCFIAVTHVMILRFNFSMALVCMVRKNVTHANGEIEDNHAEFEWSNTQVATLTGAYFYGFCSSQIIGGIIAKKFGEKLILLTSMATIAAVGLLLPVCARWHAAGIWALFANRVVQGFLSGLIIPAIYNAFSSWSSSAEKTSLMAFAFAGYPMSNIINYPISSLLCVSGVDGGWPMISYVPGTTCAIWCLVYFFLCSNSPSDHPRISKEEKEYLLKFSCAAEHAGHANVHVPVPWKAALLSIPVHALWIAQFTSYFLYYTISLNFPKFVKEVLHLGIVMSGLISALPFVGMLVFTMSGSVFDKMSNTGKFNRNWLRKGFNTAGMLLPSILFCIVPEVEGKIGPIALLCVAATFLQMCYSAGYFISHSDLVGPFSGILFGFTNTLGQIPGIVIPYILAVMAPNGTVEEWNQFFYVAAAVGGFGGVVYLVFGQNTLQSWAKVDEVIEIIVESEEEQEEAEDKVGALPALDRKTSFLGIPGRRMSQLGVPGGPTRRVSRKVSVAFASTGLLEVPEVGHFAVPHRKYSFAQ